MIGEFAERLLRMRAADESERGYHLERAYLGGIDDGLLWLRDWHTPDGQYVWMGASDAERRRALKHWIWLRHLFRREWHARGGVDA